MNYVESLPNDKYEITLNGQKTDRKIVYMLTNGQGKIYGLNQNCAINFPGNKVELENHFYWSEVYAEQYEGHSYCKIIRKGILLAGIDPEDLNILHEKSKENLSF